MYRGKDIGVAAFWAGYGCCGLAVVCFGFRKGTWIAGSVAITSNGRAWASGFLPIILELGNAASEAVHFFVLWKRFGNN